MPYLVNVENIKKRKFSLSFLSLYYTKDYGKETSPTTASASAEGNLIFVLLIDDTVYFDFSLNVKIKSSLFFQKTKSLW